MNRYRVTIVIEVRRDGEVCFNSSARRRGVRAVAFSSEEEEVSVSVYSEGSMEGDVDENVRKGS